MPLGKTADKLMYAPFTGVYEVSDEIREKLTVSEFFGENGCYVASDFETRIKNLRETFLEDMTKDDWSVKKSEMIAALSTGKKAYETLTTWINYSGDGIFTILGDAGTGKTTFIHHEKEIKKDLNWDILDLKKAVQGIKIYTSMISIPQEWFPALHGKVLSCVILSIKDYLFPETEMTLEKSHLKNRKQIQLLLQRYEERIVDALPLDEYNELYRRLQKVDFDPNNPHGNLEYCRECAKIIKQYITDYFVRHRNRDNEKDLLRSAITHLLIIIRCFDKQSKKHIIVFDNIERFIGSDEIYNEELTNFLNDIRSFFDDFRIEFMNRESNINRFAEKFQFLVSMRNTTVRNHIPAESIDFKRHTIDVSSWFPIAQIIHAKMNWYERNHIAVIDKTTSQHLEYILADTSPSQDQVLRGLGNKLDFLFNYNKRLIVSYLTDVLEDSSQPYYLTAANSFYDMRNAQGPIAACVRFSYRAVIWRTALDWLRKDTLFQEGIFAEDEDKNEDEIKSREDVDPVPGINYIWKILVVLHHFSLVNGGDELESHGTDKYMPFLDLIKKVYNESGNFLTRFYEKEFSKERTRMIKLLYYLNSYNREKNHWFQFIDVQYNVDSANRKRIDTLDRFSNIFFEAKDNPQELRIRITTAGKAYLGYVATSFEFISCMLGNRPLLCCLPSEKDLQDYTLNKQPCVIIIRKTLKEMRKYISDMQLQGKNSNLLYYRAVGSESETYVERLVKSTFGYLTNFVDCVIRIVNVSEEATEKKKNLVKLITSEAVKLWETYLPKKGYR